MSFYFIFSAKCVITPWRPVEIKFWDRIWTELDQCSQSPSSELFFFFSVRGICKMHSKFLWPQLVKHRIDKWRHRVDPHQKKREKTERRTPDRTGSILVQSGCNSTWWWKNLSSILSARPCMRFLENPSCRQICNCWSLKLAYRPGSTSPQIWFLSSMPCLSEMVASKPKQLGHRTSKVSRPRPFEIRSLLLTVRCLRKYDDSGRGNRVLNSILFGGQFERM
jgi:hypothetical protein